MLSTLGDWDSELLIYLNNLGTESFDGFWLFVTHIESWIPLFVFFVVLYWYFLKDRKKWVLASITTLVIFGITFGLMEVTKELVKRVRPNNVEELAAALRVLQNPTDFSFFSGHAASAVAVTVFVFLNLQKYTNWTLLLFLWPLLFSFSRIYVGVHYPSDILTGALVGWGLAVLGYKAFQKQIHSTI